MLPIIIVLSDFVIHSFMVQVFFLLLFPSLVRNLLFIYSFRQMILAGCAGTKPSVTAAASCMTTSYVSHKVHTSIKSTHPPYHKVFSCSSQPLNIFPCSTLLHTNKDTTPNCDEVQVTTPNNCPSNCTSVQTQVQPAIYACVEQGMYYWLSASRTNRASACDCR